MIVQPTRVRLNECIIGNVPFIENINGVVVDNFIVHSIRVYEDLCKAYFTAQLVIEDQLNKTDPYLFAGIPAVLSWAAEPNDTIYTERFRVYSFESKPKENDKYAGMIITINLIGDEYFNDVQNTVVQNFKNIPATVAAAQIHNQYIAENGGVSVAGSRGAIGLDDHPHQVLNMKPIKAIHDLLDKAVSVTVDTSAFVYFRNKDGYVIAPLEELLTSTPVVDDFIHKPGQGADRVEVLAGYKNVIHFRPMTPPSQETAAGVRSGDLDNLLKTTSFYDVKTGNMLNNLLSSGLGSGLSKLPSQAQAFIKSKTPFGARMNFATINEDRQPRGIDKNGPAGYKSKEEAFLAALGFAKKYWITVPMQSGIDITIGKRINVVYPINGVQNQKTLFVVRLIHELQFKTPGQKRFEPAQGSTDMYCVEW